jgi:hypothetical protein
VICWGVLDAIAALEMSRGASDQGAQELKKTFYGDSSYDESAKVRTEAAVGDHQRESPWPKCGALLARWATKERSHCDG